MMIPIRVLIVFIMLFVGGLCIGGVAGKFLVGSSSFFSPLWLCSISVLIFAVGYLLYAIKGKGK